MTDKKVKTEVKKKAINPVMAAMAGAVAAGIAVAGTMMMADKKNQAKVKAVVTNIKKKVDDKKAEGTDKVKKLEVIAKEAIKDVKNI